MSSLRQRSMTNSALIYSGGLDSTVLLYRYQSAIKMAISFDYGSKHNFREIECAKWNCNNLQITHIIIRIDFNSVKTLFTFLPQRSESKPHTMG